jgi:hypothetical protein
MATELARRAGDTGYDGFTSRDREERRPDGYDTFLNKEHECVKVVLKP